MNRIFEMKKFEVDKYENGIGSIKFEVEADLHIILNLVKAITKGLEGTPIGDKECPR